MFRPLRLEISVRNVDEIARLNAEISDLKKQLEEKEREVHRIAMYASLSIGYIDQLRLAKRLLDDNGLDSSFINIRKTYKE